MRLKTLSLLVSFLVASTLFAAPEEPSQRMRGPRAREGRVMIVHPTAPLTEADRSELAAQGVHVKHVLTGGRYLARVADDVQVADERIQRVEPLTAAHKIHRSAYRAIAAGRTSFRAHVMFQRDVDFDAARDAILASGGAIDPLKVSFSPSQRIDATIPSEALDALAADDRVFAIAAARNWKVRNDNATAAAASDVTPLHDAPYGLTGEGVTLSLFELARGQADHVEFGDRYATTAEGGGSSDGLHATHVAGTMIASGVRPAAKGMAPGARLHQFCVSTPCGGKMTYLDDKDEVLPTLGVIADNNSWGFILGWSSEDGYPVWNDAEEYFGAYELFTAAPIDEISIRRNILFVHSAGNEGSGQSFGGDESSAHRHVDDQGDTITDKLFCYSRNGSGTDCGTGCNGGCETTRHMPGVPFDTIGVTAAAKNILTVGNLVTDSGPFSIAGSSSRGPAKDGRVKPDVVARGTRVLSTVPTHSYQQLNGTSMAAPVVTGIAALVTEQWRRTFVNDPGPAHLKALIIAGAEDLGNPGPDYTYGFGLVNAKNSVDIIRADGGQASRIRDLTVGQGQTIESRVVVSAAEPFRTVLHWADPAIASLGDIDGVAEKALVNDLDVRVIDPAGVEHRAWILDKNSPTANATRGTNTVDNTEVVEIANATPGVYRVVVSGTAVMQGPQKAVLVTSARATAPCRDIQEAGASNDTQETAFGNLVPGQLVNAGLCAAGDVDFYKMNVTKSGPVSVAVTAGDTALRATLSGAANATRDIPANSTATISANVSSPGVVFFRVEALGTAGAEPQYSFVPEFGRNNQPRRRAGGR